MAACPADMEQYMHNERRLKPSIVFVNFIDNGKKLGTALEYKPCNGQPILFPPFYREVVRERKKATKQI